MQDPTHREIPPAEIPPAPARSVRPAHRRSKGFLGAGAALVLVALFVALFAVLSQSGHKPQTGGSPSTHATATATTPTNQHGKWQPVARLTHTPGVPVIAPSNPSVVYEVANGVVRRSADGGATWANLPNPADFPAGDTPQWFDLFVSPLSPDTLWTTVNLTNPNGNGAINCPVPFPTAFAGGNIASGASNLYGNNISLGGSIPCQVQNVSTDGGRTWKLVKLSFAFMLGTVSGDPATTYNIWDQFSATPQAQGNRLYTLTTDGPLTSSTGGGHVAMSSDGGVTWHDVSAHLSNAGLDICNVAAVSTSSTVYAVANGNGCAIDGATAPSLWRSDDAGGIWHQVTLPPNRLVFGLIATGGAQPILYAQMPTLSTVSHTANTTTLATDFFASSDGGRTWKQSPAAGVPANIVGSGTMTLLSGENVVVPFITMGAQAGPNTPETFTFAAWQPGAVSWKKLSQLSLYGIAQLQVLPDPTNSSDALWLTVPDSGDPQGNPTFSVETYLP